jgi:hypothetical protein
VSTRPDSERIFYAKKAGTIERLVGFGIPRDWVMRWIADYERQEDPLEGRYAATYWPTAYEHVLALYVAGQRPPPDTSSDPTP